jgi:hypothetical protein
MICFSYQLNGLMFASICHVHLHVVHISQNKNLLIFMEFKKIFKNIIAVVF